MMIKQNPTDYDKNQANQQSIMNSHNASSQIDSR